MNQFISDYNVLCNKEVLKALIMINDVQLVGYGEDALTHHAINHVRRLVGNKQATVEFLTGGTQTNVVALTHMTKSYEAIISASIGHINTLETGALEAAGRKIITVDTPNGKLTPMMIEKVVAEHGNYHKVKPRVVAISNTLENGLVYDLNEIKALYKVCQSNGLLFYIDGARLGYAMTADGSNLTFKAIAKYCDAFYIGGTKNGLISGECLVILNQEVAVDIKYTIKQRGAMLAKTWPVAVGFDTLLDGHYLNQARYSNELAQVLGKYLIRIGVELHDDVVSNQVFFKLSPKAYKKISQRYNLGLIAQGDDYIVVRMITSFATTKEDVKQFIMVLNSIIN